jgi:hypothetical protein
MYQYSYLLFGLILLVPWIAACIARPDIRRELVVSSLVSAPLGPLFEFWYHADYWNPEVMGPWSVGIEDLLFGFCVGGLGAVAYEVLLNRKRIPRYGKINPVFFFLAFAAGILAHAFLIPTGLNSIYVSIGSFITVTVIMLIRRRDLVPVALVSGVTLASFMLLAYQVVLSFHSVMFEQFWHLENLSGVFILRVPIEEPLWGLGWGAFIGSAWKYGYGEVCVPRGRLEGGSLEGDVSTRIA